MKRTRPKQNYKPEFKATIVKRILDGEAYSEASKATGIADNTLRKWVKNSHGTSSVTNGSGKTSKVDGRIDLWIKGERAKLMQTIGELTYKIEKLEGRR